MSSKQCTHYSCRRQPFALTDCGYRQHRSKPTVVDRDNSQRLTLPHAEAEHSAIAVSNDLTKIAEVLTFEHLFPLETRGLLREYRVG
jgi:hypothetical protein